MNRTFYEVMWALCLKEDLIEKWIESGYLIKNQLTYSWTPKAMEELEISNVIGKRKVEEPTAPVTSPSQVVKDRLQAAKTILTFEPNFLSNFISKFSKANIGLAGKTTDKNTVLKKLIKFFKDYPQYTQQDVLDATDLYIAELRKKGTMNFIRECGYFVYKKIDGVEQSDLAKWCEEKKDGGTTYTNHRIL